MKASERISFFVKLVCFQNIVKVKENHAFLIPLVTVLVTSCVNVTKHLNFDTCCFGVFVFIILSFLYRPAIMIYYDGRGGQMLYFYIRIILYFVVFAN